MSKKPHLFIATPMYGGQCFGFYTQSLLQLQKMCDAANIDVTFSFMFNESLITRARNGLAKGFLNSECTHLLFIDADIRFNPGDILPMLAADKEVICGIYPKKEINWTLVRKAINDGLPNDKLQYCTGSFVVNLVDYAPEKTVPINEPVEIWNGGTGFMLIKREVFEKLSDHVPSYINNVADLSGTLKTEPIKEFFTTIIEEETNILLSEDYYFCKLARKHGMKIWAAPWVKLAHVGTYAFEGQLTPAP